MHHLRRQGISGVFFLLVLPVCLGAAQEAVPSPESADFLFRDQFYLSPSHQARAKIVPSGGIFLIEQTSTPEWNSKVAVVTDFAPGGKGLRTQALKDIQSVDQAREWIEANKKELSFEGVPIIQLNFPLPGEGTKEKFFVGNRAFNSFDEASAQVAMIQSLTEAQGGNFETARQQAEKFVPEEESPLPGVGKKEYQAQFEKEEEIALRWADQIDLGEKLWGPFHGDPQGEPLLYQSFGESSWRSTNLTKNDFRSVLGFWTNRIVFRGIRFPVMTIDPYVELTVAPEATGNDGANQIDLVAGIEWRPFGRTAFLENTRPGGFEALKFIRNYRFYMAYYNRRNLKDEIAGIRDFDFRAGFDIFYEWGIELPPIDQAPNTGFSGLIHDYFWGEYFGNYAWRDTNFASSENFDAWILDTSLTLGLKTPPIPFAQNSLIPSRVLMPYIRFALIENERIPNLAENRYSVIAGIRWMPFRDYRFANNEWLFKMKIFGEYLAIGKVQQMKTDHSAPDPDEDWRIGFAWSLRRF